MKQIKLWRDLQCVEQMYHSGVRYRCRTAMTPLTCGRPSGEYTAIRILATLPGNPKVGSVKKSTFTCRSGVRRPFSFLLCSRLIDQPISHPFPS